LTWLLFDSIPPFPRTVSTPFSPAFARARGHEVHLAMPVYFPLRFDHSQTSMNRLIPSEIPATPWLGGSPPSPHSLLVYPPPEALGSDSSTFEQPLVYSPAPSEVGSFDPLPVSVYFPSHKGLAMPLSV